MASARRQSRIDCDARPCQSTLVRKRHFTSKAELLWNSVPAAAKDRILRNVFCAGCRGATEMVDFTGSENKGDLVLEGVCATCGGRVVRVVETSEAPPPNN